MHIKAENILNPRLSRIKAINESLKLSAALSGSYSLSANQIGVPINVFTIHKNTPFDKWLCDEAMKSHRSQDRIDDSEVKEEPEESDYLLDPKDYEIYMNPRVIGETVEQEYRWEFCLSYPNVRCMVKRPLGINVSYLNEDCLEVEEKLFDFPARMFLHELDHL